MPLMRTLLTKRLQSLSDSLTQTTAVYDKFYCQNYTTPAAWGLIDFSCCDINLLYLKFVFLKWFCASMQRCYAVGKN